MSFVSRAKETSEDSSGRPPKTSPIKDYDPSEFKLVNIGIQNPTLDMAALNAAQEAAHKVWQKHDILFSSIPTSNPPVSVSDPWRAWPGGLRGPSTSLLLTLLRNKDTVNCSALGTEVPGHRQDKLMQTLIVYLFKPHFSTPILDCEKTTTDYNWVID